MKTIKLIGETYTLRHKLKEMGFVYSYEEDGYIRNIENSSFLELIDRLDLDYEYIAPIKIDEAYIVKQKNLRAERKAKTYNGLAGKKSLESEKSNISGSERDFLSLMEPVKSGHHSAKRHRKLLEKADKDIERRVSDYNKAEEYQNKAEYWERKKYLTTEEKKQKAEYKKKIKEKAEELWRASHKVGEEFECFANATIIIKKINKKTIKSETGSMWEIQYAEDFNKYLKQAYHLINN